MTIQFSVILVGNQHCYLHANNLLALQLIMIMDGSLRAVTFPFLAFLIIIHPNFFCNGDSQSEIHCIESERNALLKFKQHLQDPSNRLVSWAGDVDCCQWVGVVCSNLTGHVHELRLRSHPFLVDHFPTKDDLKAYKSSQLGGKIHRSLLNLKHLNYLDLSFNNFGGSKIPIFLSSMGSLRHLNLSNAGFGGMIPYQLGNLSNLHYLGLGNYALYANNFQWLSGLSLLQHLDMSRVDLQKAFDFLPVTNKLPSLLELHVSGCGLRFFSPIPRVNFSSLAILDLSDNNFNHSLIPTWVLGLNNLVSLDLNGNNLQGPIPPSLQNMTSLTNLDLSSNNFNSTIPNWMYGFSRLEFLNLQDNNLQGTVSSAIGNLTSAISIDLSFNELEGKVPRSLGNLCNLRALNFGNLKCGQEISEILETLLGCVSDGLELLYMYDAQLFGHLSSEIAQFKNLAKLNLGYNSISGPIPVSLGNILSLTYLSLSSNQFSGTLPHTFGQLANLEYFHVETNALEGAVSEVHFANLTRLRYFVASGNQLTLKMSPDWVPPFQLESLQLRSWHLGPKFPQWLCSQKHLSNLDISNTRISDLVPPSFWSLSSQFSYLNLSNNQIHGEIPNILEVMDSSTTFDLSSNQFKGPLPFLSSNVSVLHLFNNSLSGSISQFVCYKMNESKQMEVLNLGGNLLSGEIPDCWMSWQNLVAMNLGNNNFTGSIPSSFGSLILLESLHLHNNKLSGELPMLLKNCSNLMTIDFRENEFVGDIPSWVGQSFTELFMLNLRSNNFHGHIPKELCALTVLQILDLADNKLSGTIPRCINNFSAMASDNDSYDPTIYFDRRWFSDNAVLVIKGKVVEYSSILKFVKSVDLSKNNLSGEIPEEVTSLHGLQSLNLSHNLLSGSIPEKIGTMGSLESIDFSTNQLSGQIPPSMSSLTFLSLLNLSNNKLIGKIPSSTQLQSFSASSFIGNELCGPPLTDSCSPNGMNPNTKSGRSKDGNGLEVDWFYVSMALGFVVGFWSVCGSLLLNKQWRILYFQFLNQMGHKLGNVVARTWGCCL